MTYVQRTLTPDEKIIRAAKLHWITFALPVILFVLGVALVRGSDAWVFAMTGASSFVSFMGVISILSAIWIAVSRVIAFMTTELTITSKRLVVKKGLISRRTEEQRLEKVDAIAVNQSVLGRLLGFGTVIAQGSGFAITPISDVDDPLAFRVAAQAAIEAAAKVRT